MDLYTNEVVLQLAFDKKTAAFILQMDGANNATSFFDTGGSGRVFSSSGAITSTAQFKSGISSGYFNGASYLSTSTTTAFDTAGIKWSAEMWYRADASSAATRGLISKRSGDLGWTLGVANDRINAFISGVGSITTSTVVPVGEWVHLRWVHDGSKLFMYVNGVLANTGGTTVTWTNNAYPLYIGASATDRQFFQGYIDQVIFDGPPEFVDDSVITKTLTRSNEVNYDTYTKKNGISSCRFNQSWLTVGPGSGFNFGTGNFTVECWFKLATPLLDGEAPIIWSIGAYGFDNGAYVQLNKNSSTKTELVFGILYPYNTAMVSYIVNTSVLTAGFNHIAAVRSYTDAWDFYVNGVKVGSNNYSLDINPTRVRIGSMNQYTGKDMTPEMYAFNGWIDDFRVTKTARYLSNFTPPGEYSKTTFAITTWNPLEAALGIVLSNNNFKAFASSNYGSVKSYTGVSSGKWYWEITLGTLGADFVMVGVGNKDAPTNTYQSFPGSDNNSWGYYCQNGTIWHNNVSITLYSEMLVTNDTLGLALNMDNGTLGLYVNNVYRGLIGTGITGKMYAMFSSGYPSEAEATANFGATPFKYAPPAGFNSGIGEFTSDRTGANYSIFGNVRDANSNNAARNVSIFRREPLELLGTVKSNATTGNYSFVTTYPGEHVLIAQPAYNENLNAIVYDRVLPALDNVVPFDSNDLIFAKFEGVHGATTSIDLTGKSFVFTSGANISTVNPLEGSSSLYTNGSSYVYSVSNPKFNLGSFAFTIRMKIRPISLNSAILIGRMNFGASGITREWSLQIRDAQTLVFYYGIRGGATGSTVFSLPFAMEAGVPYSILMGRDNFGYRKCFVNDVDSILSFEGDATEQDTTDLDNPTNNLPLTIGGFYGGSTDHFNGFIDNVRLRKYENPPA